MIPPMDSTGSSTTATSTTKPPLMPPLLKPQTTALFQTAMTTAKQKAAGSGKPAPTTHPTKPLKVSATSTFQPKAANLLGISGSDKTGAKIPSIGIPGLFNLPGSKGGTTSTGTIVSPAGVITTKIAPNGDKTVTTTRGNVTTTTVNGKVTKITDGNFTITESADGNGKTVTTTKSNLAKAGQFVGDNTKANFYKLSGSTGASAFSATVGNKNASASVSVLSAQASGNVGVNASLKDGVSGDASGTAGVYVVDAKAGVKAGPLSASGDASVGADVTGKAQIALNPLKGTVDANVGASGFIGAQANETGGVSAGGTGVSETAGVGAGLGVTAKANVGIVQGKVEANIDLGGYVGIGGKVDFTVSVNTVGIAKGALHDGSTAVHDTTKVAKSVFHDIASIF